MELIDRRDRSKFFIVFFFCFISVTYCTYDSASFLNTGGVAGVKFYIGNAAYSTDTWCICGIGSYSDFLYLYLKSIEDILNMHYFEGSALKHLKKKALKERKLIIPPINVVSDFNKLAVPFFNMINSLYRQNRILSNIRDTLLPRLMSGELKIKDIENSL